MTLANVIEAIVFAFDRHDSRREDVRYLAGLVRELQEAAEQHLEVSDSSQATWTRLRQAVGKANDIQLPSLLKDVKKRHGKIKSKNTFAVAPLTRQ